MAPEFFHDYVKNYGIAIILVTVLIKAAFWPITQRGMKSMKNMQKLQPKMAKLKEKFKDDPQKMNQEMMAMYKTYKVNPLGGCLPMLIQIPFSLLCTVCLWRPSSCDMHRLCYGLMICLPLIAFGLGLISLISTDCRC